MPRVVRAAETPPTPWANGLGRTVELWRTPQRGEVTARLSIATIESSAPFSALPGLVRVLMALSPEGVTLDLGGVPVRLAQHETVSFTGADAVRAVDVETPVTALNLMVRQGHGTPTLELHTVAEHAVVAGGVAVVARSAGLAVGGTALLPGDAVVDASDTTVTLTGRGTCVVART